MYNALIPPFLLIRTVTLAFGGTSLESTENWQLLIEKTPALSVVRSIFTHNSVFRLMFSSEEMQCSLIGRANFCCNEENTFYLYQTNREVFHQLAASYLSCFFSPAMFLNLRCFLGLLIFAYGGYCRVRNMRF